MASETRTDTAEPTTPKPEKGSWEWWKLAARRIGYGASFLVVAGVAARVSYGHIRDVVLYVHQPSDVAHLLPLSVDGLMLIATLAMAEDKANNRYPRGWARWGFWFGAAVSTAANVQAVVITSGPDPLGIAVGASAPVLLLWSIEIVARPGKPRLVAMLQNAVSAAVHMAIPATTPVTVPVEVTEETTVPEETPAPVAVVKRPPRRKRPARATQSAGVKRATVPAVTVEPTLDAVIEPVVVEVS